jgi:hypothetical protein
VYRRHFDKIRLSGRDGDGDGDDDDKLLAINGPSSINERASTRRASNPHTLEVDPDVDIPMLLSPRVPFLARVGLLSLLFVNVLIFISTNTYWGAAAYVGVTINGDVMQSEPLSYFSLANSIKDMWSAKCYPLSIIVAVFSGVWPYGKLLIMIVCWIAPGAYVSAPMRKRAMMITDAVGKWSLLDSYVDPPLSPSHRPLLSYSTLCTLLSSLLFLHSLHLNCSWQVVTP